MALRPGDQVWYDSPENSWSLGNIVRAQVVKRKPSYTVRRDDGRETVALLESSVYPTNPVHFTEDCNDLLYLTDLHEATVFQCLKRRFNKDVAYTNIGSILCAINPYTYDIPWYKEEKMQQYLQHRGPVSEQYLPHMWSVAHNTYLEMMSQKMNQCVIITGESGSGKTEGQKTIMKYISKYCTRTVEEDVRHVTEAVGKKILQANPILEAFGNAKTVRNDNSSRFGKFVRLQFNEKGHMIGAHTTRYVLEKSRVVVANPDERLFHAFYQLALSPRAGDLLVGDRNDYQCLKSGNCLTVPGMNDAANFHITCQAMADLGMSQEDIDSIWQIVAGILNLLNVDLEGEEKSHITSASLPYLTAAAEQLGISEEGLRQEMTSHRQMVRGDELVKNLGRAAAIAARDGMAKSLYINLFDWLVQRINDTTDGEGEASSWIGLLDIYGFECFDINSFEQLCINLANETLQHHYNTYIFNEDMEEYRREGIDVPEAAYIDNTECLEMISGKRGILSLLEDQCSLGKGTDARFVEMVDERFRGNKFYFKQNVDTDKFTVKHYAGDVPYSVSGFLEKNRHPLKMSTRELFHNSTDPFVKTLLPAPADSPRSPRSSGPYKAPMVSQEFTSQLRTLMTMANSAKPHWIRCISPNTKRVPRDINGHLFSTQIRASGLIETVRSRVAGFGIRIPHEEFVLNFQITIGNQGAAGKGSLKSICSSIFEKCGIPSQEAQVGRSKVFLKRDMWKILVKHRDEASLKHVKFIQRLGKGWMGRTIVATLLAERQRAYWEWEKKMQALLKRNILELEDQAHVAHTTMTRMEGEEWGRMMDQADKAREATLAIIRERVMRALKLLVIAKLQQMRKHRIWKGVKELTRVQAEHKTMVKVAAQRRDFWGADYQWRQLDSEVRKAREEFQAVKVVKERNDRSKNTKEIMKERRKATERAKLEKEQQEREAMERAVKEAQRKGKQDRAYQKKALLGTSTQTDTSTSILRWPIVAPEFGRNRQYPHKVPGTNPDLCTLDGKKL